MTAGSSESEGNQMKRRNILFKAGELGQLTGSLPVTGTVQHVYPKDILIKDV